MNALREHRAYLVAIGILIALRFVAGAVLPLSADEAYYWLWSKHLAAGYYDHPPAIAFLIRAGVTLFGDTSFGVRFCASAAVDCCQLVCVACGRADPERRARRRTFLSAVQPDSDGRRGDHGGDA